MLSLTFHMNYVARCWWWRHKLAYLSTHGAPLSNLFQAHQTIGDLYFIRHSNAANMFLKFFGPTWRCKKFYEIFLLIFRTLNRITNVLKIGSVTYQIPPRKRDALKKFFSLFLVLDKWINQINRSICSSDVHIFGCTWKNCEKKPVQITSCVLPPWSSKKE